MDSENLSETPDTSFPGFIEQGSDIVRAIGPLTLYAHDWIRTPDGIKASVTLKDDEEIVAREKITLGSGRSRATVLKRCPEEHRTDLDQTLIRLEDYLKSKMAKAQTAMASNETPVPPMSADDEREAMKLNRNPDLIEEALNDTHMLGCVGEENSKAYLLLFGTSRKLLKPINTTVKAESSSGKNHVTQSVLDLIPPEDVIQVSSATAKALFYMRDPMSHKILMMAERHGSEESDYSFRTMQSEGNVAILVPQKQPDGSIGTERRVVEGPVAFIETTTRTHLHQENETRSFDLYINESEEHTKAIFDAQNRQYINPISPETRRRILKKWHNAQRLLKSYPILIPFVNKITFPTKPLRVRRDRGRFLALIEASALLFQYQRQQKEINGVFHLVATIADYQLARRLAIPILKDVLRGATPKCMELITAAQELGINGAQITKRDFEVKLGWSRRTVDKFAKEALMLGCLEESQEGQRGRGKSSKFIFVKSIDEVELSLPNPASLIDSD
jgi:hypothetical protein